MNKTRLLTHAHQRLDERTSMNDEDLIRLIDHDGVVPIGRENGKLHMLFYSHRDKQWFVAIMDETKREVITILNFDYHNRWRVSLAVTVLAQAAAQKLDQVPK